MRVRLKEAGLQVSEERDSEPMSRRTEIAYKAQFPGKSAPHDEALGLGGRVDVALGVFAFLCRERSCSYPGRSAQLFAHRQVVAPHVVIHEVIEQKTGNCSCISSIHAILAISADGIVVDS